MSWSTFVRVVFALSGMVLTAAAPPPEPQSSYEPRQAFAPFDMHQAVNSYRSGSGLPGPVYWQNRADYTIRATLDPASHSISGTVEIRYTNNSPDKLDVLWLQIEQNRYLPSSRGTLSGNSAPSGFTPGMSLDSVTVQQGKTGVPVQPLISDTRAQLHLPSPLPPHGLHSGHPQRPTSSEQP